MLRVYKLRQATLSPMRGFREKLKRWWMVMTNEEQRDIILRGMTVAVCAVAATVTLPAIGSVQAEKRAEADFSAQAARLAQIEDGGVAVRTADHTPALLDSPWMRTVEYSLKRDTDASMSRYAMRDRDGAALASLVSFRPEQLKRAETIDAETKCMAQAVYYESANEPLEGQLAVAEVIANRVRDHRYPDSACGVVFQGATRTTGCQFTFTCDGAMKRTPSGENWERAKKIAAHTMMQLNEIRTAGATHYHATYVDPIWNAGLIKTDKIGLHIFYRFPRGAEWAQVRQDFSTPRAPTITLANADANAMVAEMQAAEVPANDAVKISAAPATVTTSTRTLTNSSPRLTTIRAVATTDTDNAMDEYTAKQLGISAVGIAGAGAMR